MSFKKNDYQQMTLHDSFLNLSPRVKKIVENSWCSDFANIVFPAINEEAFSVLYSSDPASRPNTPVNFTVGAFILKENSNLKTQNQQAQQHINNLSSENETLSGKVAIASQLDATGIWAEGRNKKGKAAKKIKDVKKFAIGFSIARNVTASTGIRSVYIRITTPTGEVLSKGGTFSYENRNLAYSIRKDIEYTGEEQAIQVWWDVAETLSAGTYRVDIFADGQNIGTTSFSFDQ